MTWRSATVIGLRDETATARTIALAVRDWPSHIAGQHIDVRLTAPDGYSAVRSYSLASAPNSDERIEITVERLANGVRRTQLQWSGIDSAPCKCDPQHL